jgi:integrase
MPIYTYTTLDDPSSIGATTAALGIYDTRALQAWLGHRNIQHTVRYTELAPDRFKNFWRLGSSP